MSRFLLGALSLAMVAVAGCATGGDLDDLRVEMHRIAARQDSLLIQQGELIESLRSETALTRDTLRTQSDQLFGFRGDISNSLRNQSETLALLETVVGENQRSITALRSEMAEIRDGLAQAPVRDAVASGTDDVGPVGDVTDGSASGIPTDDPAELYGIAMQMVEEGSLGTARMAFEELLQTHPNHSLAPEAMFKLADIIEQGGDLEGALEAYREIRSRFPTATRAPDALYRVALIQIDLGERADAVATLELIVNTYPDALFAEVAADKLAEIRRALGEFEAGGDFRVGRALSKV